MNVASIEAGLLSPAGEDRETSADLDLSAATSFDTVGLVQLLALVAGWRNAGRKISVRLPSDPQARHLLRQARFPAALEKVMRTPFRLMVDRSDLRYFTARSVDAPISSITPTSAQASVLALLEEQHHFGLSAHRPDDAYSLTRMLEQETGHWRGYAMVQLLRSVLHGQAIEVSRVIVQELVSNIMEHPAPSIAVVASQLKLREMSSELETPALTIAAWDDGTSIIDNLRFCLDQGGKLRVWPPDSVDYFTMQTPSPSMSAETYHSDWTPEPRASDAELLLASLLPGITTKPVGEGPGSPQSSLAARMDWGYGLYALYKAAVDHFHGSVELRCMHTRLSLSRPNQEEPYLVEIRDDLPALTGTIVTVRLPLRDD
ncbi:hypothetical protein [Actinomadura sp. 3N407]|uniref:hypothetical protein n=1 Tax=Actinomadura sp. 3N407 TaxID=3457423 RepID=UPI003FCD0744